MAASPSTSSIRVRLYFDYPPPAVSDCRMCWVLVDLNKCRVVADLESIIRDKFEFGRKNVLNLFIEDCYLPHTESIYVVRDNDSIRVKVERVGQVNGDGHTEHTSSDHLGRKRQRDAVDEEEQQPAENGVTTEWRTKKKRKKKSEERQKTEPEREGNEDVQKKKKKDKKKKGRKEVEGNASSTKASPKAAVTVPVKSTKKPAAAPTPISVGSKAGARTQDVSSSDSSDGGSEEDVAPKKTPQQKPAAPPKTPSTTPATVSKATPKPKPPTATQPQPPPPSSSSETESSSDEAPGKAQSKDSPKKKPVVKPASTTPNGVASDKSTASRPPPGPPSVSQQPVTSTQRQTGGGAAALPAGKVLQKPESSSSDSSSSEEEIKLVIKRPIQGSGIGLLGRGLQALGMGLGTAPGRGRGNPSSGGGERGRGRGREGRDAWGRDAPGGRGRPAGDFRHNYDEVQKQPSYQSDTLTNNSVILQNPVESVPKRDYSAMPMLAAPPQVGQKIAFKLLELTESYTPEVSEYKEGKIVSFDPTNNQIELQLTYAAKGGLNQGYVEPGKFDLVYDNADGSSTIEYAVSRGSLVTERWNSLLEPRLII